MAKTNAIDIFEDWVQIDALSINLPSVGDIELGFDNTLQIELAPLSSSDFTDPVEILIEGSHDNTNWTTIKPLSILLVDNVTTTINDADVTVGDTQITLTSATDFADPAFKWLIEDGTDANSETVVTVQNSSGEIIDLLDVTIRAHANSLNVYGPVRQWSVKIATSISKVRVMFNNQDGNFNVMGTARVLKTTSIT